MTGGDLGIDGVSVVRTVGSERRDWAIHLIEQGTDLGHVIEIAGGQRRRRDLAGVGLHGDVQLSPSAQALAAAGTAHGAGDREDCEVPLYCR